MEIFIENKRPSRHCCSAAVLASVHTSSLGLFLPSSEVRSGADVRDFSVDRNPVVVEARRLQDDSGRADANRQREDPQEEAV